MTVELPNPLANTAAQPLLEMRAITKTFPGVRALHNVSLRVREGEIHALVGENGAGKSTLMKVLSGVYPHGSYEGEIRFRGQVRAFRNVRDSEALGIIIIHQELALVPLLSIAENLFLGHERARFGVIDWSQATLQARALLAKVGLDEAPDTPVAELGVGKQQLVEIAKALAKEVKLLILDEPTASLSESDSEALLKLLLEFKAQGITSVLISHKLNEVVKVADTITVLRDGEVVETLDARAGPVSEARIVRGMVGRELTQRYPPRTHRVGETLFEVRGWNVFHPVQRDRRVIHDASFYLRRGEVVGLAGLMGAGRTELAMSLFGRSYGRRVSGEVRLRGQVVDLSTVPKAIAQGVAYVTEDRKALGLILEQDIRHNLTLANLGAVAKGVVIDAPREVGVAHRYREELRIRCRSIEQEAVNLSGGNQQKVVLGKWLFAEPEVLLLDEPTRGVDVGAKFEIYTLINRLAAQGKAILLISSELPEVLGMSDRIYVMNEGRIVGEMDARSASQERIMREIVRLEDAPPDAREVPV
ncbi:ABC transporter related protein [Truepera radiovictrix DSM 17093]|uniref:ABC transporter related protein n=2 Tax=Truepera TaxID=332248 RepID=D7CXK4_TRURR|nr:multiple monosaccharide ABC transporter ATP-binding protein [Truepera radiovictrix]ADI14606.1 ABC transporter related protein [Truepera radiovictrix DSM 17093]WMT56844.1 sugar ABC transporter ATP-binding protein [Truepera radiovictrix]